MTSISGLTEGQTRFLRGFGSGRIVPEGKDWPKAALLERWMRVREFRRRFEALARAMGREIRMRLLGRAVLAARRVAEIAGAGRKKHSEVRECMEVIRLALTGERTVRPRRSGKKSAKDEGEDATFEELAGGLAHPEAVREEVIQFIRERCGAEGV